MTEDGGQGGGVFAVAHEGIDMAHVQSAPTRVVVSVIGTLVTVWVDGIQVLQRIVTESPPAADLVFTAASGGLTDNFSVPTFGVS